MKCRLRYYIILIYICIYNISNAETVYTVSPSKITVETPVTITFLLATNIKTIDSVSFNVTDGITISEYTIVPQKDGLFFTVKLKPTQAGKHYLKNVVLKSGSILHTFDIGAAFIVEGVITINGIWNGPIKVYQYEPFILELTVPINLNENVYKELANKINKYCEAMYIDSNKYLVIARSSCMLPDFQLKITDENTNGAVQFLIKTEPFTIVTIDIPPGTDWVTKDNTMHYTVHTKKSIYSSNEPVVFDLEIHATGIPVSSQTKSIHIVGTNEYKEHLEIPLRTQYSIVQNTLLSMQEGSGTVILTGIGRYTIVTDPIVVFNLKTGKQQLISGKEIEISVEEDIQESADLQNLLTKEQRLLCEIMNTDNSECIKELTRLKSEQYGWWSRSYAARIAFALVIQDKAYASYQIMEAQKHGIPILLQVTYPTIYQSLFFTMPAPQYFLVLLCICGITLLLVIKLQKQRNRKSIFLTIVLISSISILAVLLGLAIYERIPHYGITDATPVYKVPDRTATTIAMCSTGSIVKILSASHAWNYIEFEGKQGWVPAAALVYRVK
ncbi:MAG TPA: hypothetical protein P5519_10730 [Spirochaetia bacterium]|nr:hypothetical protein [Spirochaetia bacterium]